MFSLCTPVELPLAVVSWMVWRDGHGALLNSGYTHRMSNIETAIPGYTSTTIPEPEELAGTDDWSPEQWKAEFSLTGSKLRGFLAARDPLVVLARSALRFNSQTWARRRDKSDPQLREMQQTEIEIAQALLLIGGEKFKSGPTSPGNFVRYWALISRHLHSFIRKHPYDNVVSPVENMVRRRARLQTLYYRNLFSRSDCEQTMNDILRMIDPHAQKVAGYALSDLFQAMAELTDIVEKRIRLMGDNINTLMSSKSRSSILKSIDFFREKYPLADRVWGNRAARFPDTEQLRLAGFQMSEFAWPWVFTFDRQTLEDCFTPSIVDALYSLALTPGSLPHMDPEHIYLGNPVWKKPYLLLENGSIFAPLPQLVFSYPFLIFEGVIENLQIPDSAYEDARAKHLESAIVALLKIAMPNAKVYQGVIWDDPDTGKQWENDVVALLGNYVFVFEAKSGRIKDAARRGGDLSLRKNFKELFIEPGVQGWRLQNYLDKYRDKATFRLKSDNSVIDFSLDRPKVVFRYSVCYEHFANLTSARYYLKELGLITNDTAWAPVLTLGELQMISRYLDTELSFQHYLTRRQSVDELIDFDGDEQDILSIYLTNGLYLDPETIAGEKVLFMDADGMVRKPKKPRKNRATADLIGVQLSPLWAAIVRELYQNKEQRHRYDIIDVVLNQLPPAMAEFEKRIRRFRRGVPHNGEDLLMVKFPAGKKIFVVACHLASSRPDPDEWQETGRQVVGMHAQDNSVVECAMFMFLRRSKESTFDAVSFYRYGFTARPTEPSSEAQPV